MNIVPLSTVIIFAAIIVWLLTKLVTAKKVHRQMQSRLTELDQTAQLVRLPDVESNLNPHLFKNILNSIQSHAYQTYFALDKLANVLDYILYESKSKFVTPKEEIEFALNLIEINKIKISPLFDLTIKTSLSKTEPSYQQQVLAPLISIDLIENAFKHADLQSEDAFIAVTFEFRDNIFALRVANKISNQVVLRKEKGGIGTAALDIRLRSIYGHRFSLDKYVEGNVYIAFLKINLLGFQPEVPVA